MTMNGSRELFFVKTIFFPNKISQKRDNIPSVKNRIDKYNNFPTVNY